MQGYAATGGVREAVAQSAERLYRELSPAQQGMLHDLMVRLVASDDNGEPVRTGWHDAPWRGRGARRGGRRHSWMRVC